MTETDFKTKIGELPHDVLNNGEIFNTERLKDEQEIMKFMNILYEVADELSPTGTRTPVDIKILEKTEQQLKEDLDKREQETKEDEKHSENVQVWADKERKKKEDYIQAWVEELKKREDSVKGEKIEKITRLQEALKNPKIKELLLKVMNHELTPQQAFADIKGNTDLKEKMMSLTYPTKYRETRTGGKSRVFRRKNKKTTSTSRRNARRTQRHRKSSTRRSTRK